MELCRTNERQGAHVYEPGLYDGQPIMVCVFCCRRQDGIAWFAPPYRHPEMGTNLPYGFKRCPYVFSLSDEGFGLRIVGCDGIGEVSFNHPARRWRYGKKEPCEEHAFTGDPKDGYICANCRGTGIVRV